MIVLVMVIAVQSPGLVMALPIVKTKHMVAILLAMIMMVVIVKVVQQVVQQVVAVKIVMIVNMTLRLMVPNAAIPHGMSMVLAVMI